MDPLNTISDRLLASLASGASEAAMVGDGLLWLRQSLGVRMAALVSAEGGRWRATVLEGEAQTLPYDLMAEALDQGSELLQDAWWMQPLAVGDESDLLVVACEETIDEALPPQLRAMADRMAHAMQTLRQYGVLQKRNQWLEAVLEVAAQWRESLDMNRLLEQMAMAATRLLAAERASIFLWDKPRRQLVARPALGVEGGELRIPDDGGVVGRVVQSGEGLRVDPDDPEMIDRSVDQQLRFHTRTLACVPLRDARQRVMGAFEVINKQGLDGRFTDEDMVSLAELAAHAALAIDNSREYEQLLKARDQMAEVAANSVRLIGESAEIVALRATIARVAETDLSVLVLGENGTGKEVVSQLVHYSSSRRRQPLVALNCAALPETLLESELFGHEAGAFTDARERRIGKFEQADGGTLFLDEIGEMSPNAQAKLLRALEEKVIVRVGGTEPVGADVRVIAATNRDLSQLVQENQFRQDLFFRLTVVTLELPPLRDRGNDILELAKFFLDQFCQRANRSTPTITAAARKRLLAHSWPGNVRELRNVMERIAYLSNEETIDVADLSFSLQSAPEFSIVDLPLTEATRQFQVQYIEDQIRRCNGNMTVVAEKLGIHRSNLYRKMKQLGMEAKEE